MKKKLTEREIIKKHPLPDERLPLLWEIHNDAAERKEWPSWGILQAYTLGVMDGKRTERARRKGKK